MTHEKLVEKVLMLREKHDTSREAAQKLNISATEMKRFLEGGTPPPAKMLEALGLERVISYREVR